MDDFVPEVASPRVPESLAFDGPLFPGRRAFLWGDRPVEDDAEIVVRERDDDPSRRSAIHGEAGLRRVRELQRHGAKAESLA